MSPRVPRRVAITTVRPEGELDPWIRFLEERRVDAVQVRDKQATDRAVYEYCRAVRERLPDAIALLVNSRPDIAVAVAARGVHLPADGLPVADVRRCYGDDLLVGRSTHSRTEVEAARDRGADYVFFGPVYRTPEKLRYGPPRGLAALEAASSLGIPVLAVGGVTDARITEVRERGAHGIAAIRLFSGGKLSR